MTGPRAALARAAAIVLAGAALFACAPTPEKPAPPPEGIRLAPAAFGALPGWAEDRQDEALAALRRSCARMLTLPADRAIGPGGIAGRAGDWRVACATLPAPGAGAAAARAYFEARFRPWAVIDPAGDAGGLVTGYYEAELTGARRPGGRFTVPIYCRPDDLVTVDLGRFADDLKGRRVAGRVEGGRLVRYHDRAAIDGGAIRGSAKVLVWVDSTVDAFFLHIQGSGRVKLAGGGVMRVGYDGTNDLPFTAIGRRMIERGMVPRDGMSMQAIRAWLARNPAEAAALMRENARFVFFRELTGDGPIGAEGVALTPGRSIAVDKALMPFGAPVWLATSQALPPLRAMNRLVVAQDTGAAIRGAVRADFFFGAGAEAARQAGGMKRAGRYWLLLPAGVAPPAALNGGAAS
jgi:membrane-bound lytic murein transglycosylase A